jgi:F-type H+-transporting ATPase subunit epsilon
MANTFHLTILTPYGRYYDGSAEFLEVFSEKYSLGILPGHAPLISTLSVSKMTIQMPGGHKYIYAIGGGAINIDKDGVTLILNSVERKDEIDVTRANEAKKRAEERLNEAKQNSSIDTDRAKLAYVRALNRINIASKD